LIDILTLKPQRLLIVQEDPLPGVLF
jgi:hypothetical protein